MNRCHKSCRRSLPAAVNLYQARLEQRSNPLAILIPELSCHGRLPFAIRQLAKDHPPRHGLQHAVTVISTMLLMCRRPSSTTIMVPSSRYPTPWPNSLPSG